MFRNLLFTIISLFLLSSVSYAACPFTNGTAPGGGNTITCNTNPPNPDTNSIEVGDQSTNLGDELTVNANSGIDTGNAENAVNLGLGNDIVIINGPGALVRGNRAIDADEALNITINGGLLEGTTSNVVDSTGGAAFVDTVNMFGGSVIGPSDGIATGSGSDIINILGGSIESNEPIDSSLGDDQITIRNARLAGTNLVNTFAIAASGGNDLIILGDGAEIFGRVRCGSGDDTVILENVASFDISIPLGFIDGASDIDELIFRQTVSLSACDFLTSQINNLNPSEDSFTINEVTYVWENFEIITADLDCRNIVSPVPTLTQWGLIAMAVILGIVGYLVIRRRRVSA